MINSSALTRDEARVRADLLDVRSYSIDLDFTRGEEVFGSATLIRFAAEDGATTFVDVRPEVLRRVVLNGRELDPGSLASGRFELSGLQAENELRVEADMPYSRTGEGVHRFVDPADQEVYLYANCGPDQAPRVFACFDQPDLKGEIMISVTAPEAWTVLSNGACTHEGKGRWTFAPTIPMSTYLVTVTAGRLHSRRSEHDGIPLGLYCRKSLAAYLDEDAEELFALTRGSFDRLHQVFDDRYAFGKYDQVFVPEMNWGAVEKPSCVLFNERFLFQAAVTDGQRELRAVVMAHEMAHMWFGNLVTMRWWDDIWLSESFAEYMGYEVAAASTRFTTTWSTFAAARKAWGYDADQRRSTHPVAADSVEDVESALMNFDGISYVKGASALRQLVAWAGEDAFLKGVNDYFSRYRLGNAALADLLDCIERAAGRDMHEWARRWLRTTGIDLLRPEVSDDGTLTVIHEGERPHRIQVGGYDLVNERLVLRERLELDLPETTRGHFSGPERPDLVLLNDGDLSYAKVRLDERSWRSVTAALSTIDDPLTRAVLWNTARDMVRDADLPADSFLTLVEAQLPSERVVTVVEAVLAFARQQVIDRYLPPALRAGALTRLAFVCRQILEGTSDDGLRLAATRTLISSAQTSDELTELEDWLRTGTIPDGPALDAELRWQALLRLTVWGRADEPNIEAELARDPGLTSEENAAKCRAALPDPAAKERAWNLLFNDEKVSKHLLLATAQGFWQPSRPETTEAFVERYFQDIAAMPERAPVVARLLGLDLFPAHAVTPATEQWAADCLAHNTLSAPLHRALSDQLDDLRRALHLQ
ncbi:aminopeptidase N [Spirillospora sp. CA-294931]|uniref:aminopeptidase N n=1 Tax=Spirillospora sp. CA-294931 TaxID=3240042 RepID=UPI003D8DC520